MNTAYSAAVAISGPVQSMSLPRGTAASLWRLYEEYRLGYAGKAGA